MQLNEKMVLFQKSVIFKYRGVIGEDGVFEEYFSMPLEYLLKGEVWSLWQHFG